MPRFQLLIDKLTYATAFVELEAVDAAAAAEMAETMSEALNMKLALAQPIEFEETGYTTHVRAVTQLADLPAVALKVEAPKPAPKPAAPKVEAPKPAAPKVEAPKAEAPKVEAPKAEAPKVEETK